MLITQNSGARYLAEIASEALIEEASLSPKPGLVDRRSSGSHTDMNFELMCVSARTLKPYFEEMAHASWNRPVSKGLREDIGEIGRRAEIAMLESTGGVNTHKGAIWALGLLLSASASGRMLHGANRLMDEAGAIARIEDCNVKEHKTHGSEVKSKYRCFGAKEEAQFGFPHIRRFGLPVLCASRRRGEGVVVSRLNSLIAVLSDLSDTCVLYRGGLESLHKTQSKCRSILRAGGAGSARGEKLLEDMDSWMKASSLSPGGAADLLAATLFVHRMSDIHNIQ